MHPIEEIRGELDEKLKEKKIVLCVTGSIAAVETIHLAHELIRHGATVYPVMTQEAIRIIHPNALECATGNKPITELTGKVEHVSFCGKNRDRADLLLIAPCTANTLSKIASGIADTPVTTFAATAVGSSIPVIIAPAMHKSMYDHPFLKENVEKCKSAGIKFMGPKIEEGKAKIADIEEIVENVIYNVGKKNLRGKKILVIGGSTIEPIDDVRIVTNRSSGKTATALVKNAFERGAETEFWYGNGTEKNPPYIPIKRFESVKDLISLIEKTDLKKFDIIVNCAAISDYTPERKKGKIPSGKEEIEIRLKRAQKILPKLREATPSAVLVGFKLESEEEGIVEKAFERLKEEKIDLMIANTVKGVGKDENEIWIIDRKERRLHKKGKKEDLAAKIFDLADHIHDTITK